MAEKKFKLKTEELRKLVDKYAGCIATDKITVEGLRVGFMYREKPDEDIEKDSGWRFFSGTETQEYVDDDDNSQIYSVNTIANYDPAIIPYLTYRIGTELERVAGTDTFQKIEE